jgi:hypothetical protein
MSENNSFLFYKKILASEGYRIKLLIDALDATYHIFNQNYMDLKLILTASSMPNFMFPLLDVHNNRKLDDFLEEIRRKLHNFLTASQTLIAHTRNVINDNYKDSSFKAEYQHEIDYRFNNDPLSRFTKDFRNYILHFGLPATLSNLHINPIAETRQGAVDTFASLEKESLRRWPNWSRFARDFIETLPDKPKIIDIVDPYYEKVASFHNWLIKRLTEIHQDELRQFEQMVDEYKTSTPFPE